jgi:hypothetical protein
MERWYNTLRQRIARYVRETLSFSKCDVWHQIVTEMFIVTYNLSCIRNVIEIKAQLFFGDLYVLCGSLNLAFQASDPL